MKHCSSTSKLNSTTGASDSRYIGKGGGGQRGILRGTLRGTLRGVALIWVRQVMDPRVQSQPLIPVFESCSTRNFLLFISNIANKEYKTLINYIIKRLRLNSGEMVQYRISTNNNKNNKNMFIIPPQIKFKIISSSSRITLQKDEMY